MGLSLHAHGRVEVDADHTAGRAHFPRRDDRVESRAAAEIRDSFTRLEPTSKMRVADPRKRGDCARDGVIEPVGPVFELLGRFDERTHRITGAPSLKDKG